MTKPRTDYELRRWHERGFIADIEAAIKKAKNHLTTKQMEIEIPLEAVDQGDELDIKINFLRRSRKQKGIIGFATNKQTISRSNKATKLATIEPTPLQLKEDPDYWLRGRFIESQQVRDAELTLSGAEEWHFARIKLIPHVFFNSLKGSLKQIRRIKKIDLIVNKHTGKVHKVVVNGNYHQKIRVRDSNVWGKLFELAKLKVVPEDSKSKEVADYFNSNAKNPIYSQTTYVPTTVLKVEGHTLQTAIPIEAPTARALSIRTSKVVRKG